MINYYEVLEVPESASQDEIKVAYRKLAMKHHPDRNAGDKISEEKFKKVQEAYDILSEESKRKKYDFTRKYGHDPREYDANPFSELFRNSHYQESLSGYNLAYNLACSFEETIHGTQKSISIDTNEICSACDGEGHKKGTSKDVCYNCKGTGQYVQTKNFGNKVVQIATTCNICMGKGKSVSKENICKECNNGLINNTISLQLDIPSGVSYGSSIRFENKGMYSNPKGKRGFCLVRIVPEKHDVFELNQNYDIILPLCISVADAVLGTNIDIPLIDGTIESIKIPSGTNNGDRITLNGKGLFKNKSIRANMIIHITVETPVKNEQVEDIMKKLKDIESPEILPKVNSFRDKIENYKKDNKYAKTT